MDDVALLRQGAALVQAGPWSGRRFTIVRPFWSWLGRRYLVYAETGELVLFVRHPLFRVRSEFTLYADEGESQPLLTVRSRRLLGIRLEHDVLDGRDGRRLASVRARGLGLLRDGWDILDDADRVAGEMVEVGRWLLRRLFKQLPGRHAIRIGGVEVAELVQRFRLFTREFDLLLRGGAAIDPRFLVAASVLAVMSDVRREES